MLAAITVLGMAVIPSIPVYAQGSAALSITPRKNYTIQPGDLIEDTFLVNNLDKERPLYLAMRVVDFTYANDGGTPKLLLDPDEPEKPWSLRRFIDIPETYTVDPDSSASIPISISLPEDYKAGSYYSAVLFSSSSSEGGNVGLSASGVSLVFVTTPGEVEENMSLQKLGAYWPKEDTASTRESDKPTGDFKLINIDMPLRIGYTLKNEGNVAESPVGSMTIKSMFGKEISINDINPSGALALIDQTRTFSVCVKTVEEEVDFDGSRQTAPLCSKDTGLWPGLYTVELNAFYGWNGNPTKEIVGKAWFIYMPIWAIAALVLALAFVGYHVWRIVRFFKSRKSGLKSHSRSNK